MHTLSCSSREINQILYLHVQTCLCSKKVSAICWMILAFFFLEGHGRAHALHAERQKFNLWHLQVKGSSSRSCERPLAQTLLLLPVGADSTELIWQTVWPGIQQLHWFFYALRSGSFMNNNLLIAAVPRDTLHVWIGCRRCETAETCCHLKRDPFCWI